MLNLSCCVPLGYCYVEFILLCTTRLLLCLIESIQFFSNKLFAPSFYLLFARNKLRNTIESLTYLFIYFIYLLRHIYTVWTLLAVRLFLI